MTYKITTSTYNNLDNCQRIIVVVNRYKKETHFIKKIEVLLRMYNHHQEHLA